MISDNTWVAIQQQAEQQARDKAQRAAKSKSTKSTKRTGVRRTAPKVPPKPTPPIVPVQTQAKPTRDVAVQQPSDAQVALPSKGPWGATQVPVAPTTTSLPSKPEAPSADDQQKAGTQLTLSARHKGMVRK